MATVLVHDEPPLLASFHRSGEGADTYQVWADGAVLRVWARGYWDMPTAKKYAGDIGRIINDLRQAHPNIRAIVDRRETPIFAPGVHEVLLEAYRNVLRAGDRVALVVGSSLTKGQIRQIAGREETQSFLSVSAARTWVLAYG